MKKIGDLKETDFDENGFAYLGSEYLSIAHFNAARFNFFSKNGNIKVGSEGEYCSHDAFLTLGISKDEYEHVCQVLVDNKKPTGMVDTIKLFLKIFPEQTYSILRDMPSCLYENKVVAKEIFSTIQKDNDTIECALESIRSRIGTIKAYKKGEKTEQSTKKNPEESLKNLIQTYEKEIKD